MKSLLSFLVLLAISGSSLSAQINWMSMEEAIEASKKEPRKIFVDVYTDWCGWCKRMDATTFKDKAVVEALNKNFYAVKFDAEQKKAITFKNKLYEFQAGGSRGSHGLAQKLLQGRMGYPTVVFLDNNFEVIQPVPGYQDAEAMTKIVTYFGEDYYLTTPWAEYAGK